MGLRGPLPRRSPKAVAPVSQPLSPPPWLPAAAVEVWKEHEPALRAAGRLRPEHGDTFAAWACTAAELRDLSVVIARDGSTATGPHGTHPSAAHSAAVRLRGTLLALGKSLGLDPASAARLDAMPSPAGEERDELAEFAAKRGRPTGEPPATFKRDATIIDYVRGTAAS
jgi:phage terminase small subunit